MIDDPFRPREKRSYVVLDLESAVLDESGHRRYQAMERWVPHPDVEVSRRGYKRHEDPLLTPRWPFQTITTAAAMLLVEHDDGGVDVARFDTLSAPDLTEKQVVAGLLQLLGEAPSSTELVTWAGMAHDVPLLVSAAMRYGLTMPPKWRWLAFGSGDSARHLDLARALTGGLRMKPVHMAEVLAAMNIPAKMTAPAFAIARLIYAGQWDAVQEACESDVVSTALLLARWRTLLDGRADVAVVEDRIMRRVVECRQGRSYLAELQSRRDEHFRKRLTSVANDADRLGRELEASAA